MIKKKAASRTRLHTGLTHCQARHKNQLDFSYNASFASQNVAKVMMKENGMGLKAVQACALRGCETWCLGAM